MTDAHLLRTCAATFSDGMFEGVNTSVDRHLTRISRSDDHRLLNRKL